MSESFIAGDPPPQPFGDTHPAWCAAYGRAGNWVTAGASVVGPGHIRRYRARDDAFLMMASGSHLVVAVADGVGGQMYSRFGAARCVHALCSDLLQRLTRPHVRRTGVDDFDPATLTRHLSALHIPRTTPRLSAAAPLAMPAANWYGSGSYHWSWNPYRRPFPNDLFEDDEPPPAPPSLPDAMLASLRHTRESFLGLAAGLRCRPRQLTCTLLAVVIDLETNEATAAQLGDGAILSTASLRALCRPSPRTSEDNPYTIADEDWLDGLQVAAVHAPGYLLMTDGMEDFFPDCAEGCRAALTASADDSQRALQLLEWLHLLTKPHCEDDRTLAAIIGAAEAYPSGSGTEPSQTTTPL